MILTLYQPKMEELTFRQKLLADPGTMTYNHAYGGVIDFPPERWAEWYERWINCTDGSHFYRYLRTTDEGKFVGGAAYHRDEARGMWLCDILVLSDYRGRWYGSQGLELLCAVARANGIELLHDDIAADNPAVEMFLRHGFQIVERTPESILVRKDLLLHRRGREQGL